MGPLKNAKHMSKNLRRIVSSTAAGRPHRTAEWRDLRIRFCRCLPYSHPPSSMFFWTAFRMEARRAITATLVPLFVSAVVALSLVSRKHILPAASAQAKHSATHTDWPVYGGQSADDRYSALHQIHRSNVHKLKVAWTFDTKEPGGLQTNPLIVGRVLFGFTPTQKVIALDAATGKNLWTFSTGTPGLQPTRGLSYWTDGTQSILFAGLLTNLYAIDPATGKLISTFGDGGK